MKRLGTGGRLPVVWCIDIDTDCVSTEWVNSVDSLSETV